MIGCTPLMNAIKGKMYIVIDRLLEGKFRFQNCCYHMYGMAGIGSRFNLNPGGADPNLPSGRKTELPLIEAVYQGDEFIIKVECRIRRICTDGAIIQDAVKRVARSG
jgi:hypothetical protein